MTKKNPGAILQTLTLLMVLLSSGASFAADEVRKVVIQVSTADVQTQQMALNNAVNLQKALGVDNVIVEVVAYGPGLTIMTPKSPASERIPSLALQDITFSACNNTKTKMEEKTGKKVVLVEGVEIVPSGVLRILELQEQGYAYIRP